MRWVYTTAATCLQQQQQQQQPSIIDSRSPLEIAVAAKIGKWWWSLALPLQRLWTSTAAWTHCSSNVVSTVSLCALLWWRLRWSGLCTASNNVWMYVGKTSVNLLFSCCWCRCIGFIFLKAFSFLKEFSFSFSYFLILLRDRFYVCVHMLLEKCINVFTSFHARV